MRNREIVEAVKHELRKHGATDIEYAHQKRGHPRVWFTWQGERLYKAIAGTSGDRNAHYMARRDVRMILGVAPDPTPRAPQARKQRTKAPAPEPECPTITVGADPWKPLERLRDSMKLIDEPGVYDLPEAEYHADPCAEISLSRSILTTLLERSPRHAWKQHPRLNMHFKRDQKRTFDIGGAAHALLLQGEEAFEELDYPNYKKDVAKQNRDAAYAAGKTPLLKHEAQQVRAMVAAARVQIAHHPDAQGAFQGKAEQTLICQIGGVWMRARLDDLLPGSHVFFDYKTTGDASPGGWWRLAYNHALHWQADFYKRVIREVLQIPNPDFRFVVQEREPPYAIAVYQFGPEAEAIAEQEVTEGIRRWAWCLANGRWGGYPARMMTLDTPGYVANAYEAEKLRAEVLLMENKDIREIALTMQAPLDYEGAEP